MQHGGDLGDAIASYGGEESDWIDLSTGINPRPWPWREALSDDIWRVLPSRKALAELLDAARKTYNVPKSLAITAAAGTEALIARLPSILPNGDVAILSPTYSSHETHWRRSGRRVTPVGSLQSAEFEAARGEASIILLVNPNNPDGRTRQPQRLIELARTLAHKNGFLIIDEAFADVTPEISILPHLAHAPELPVIVLRSFGKFYGLAGLRLGFAIGSEKVTSLLAADFGGWSISGPALAIGAQALRDEDWRNMTRQRLRDDAAKLDDVIRKAGVNVLGGTDLFRLLRCENAAQLHRHLAQKRIWTRFFDFDPTIIRLGLPANNAELAAVAAALESLSPSP